MPISDYQPPTAVVEFPKGGSLTLRGLALDDVGVLMRSHLVDLDKIVALFQGAVADDKAVPVLVNQAIAMAKDAPALAANIIALACDDGDNVPQYRRLSMPLMVQCIKQVIVLTFEEAGGPKKFVESLMEVFRGMRAPETGSLT